MFAILDNPQFNKAFTDLPESLRNHPRLVIDTSCCPFYASTGQDDDARIQAEVESIIDDTGLDPTDDVELQVDRSWAIPPKSKVAAARRKGLDIVHLIRTNMYSASEEALLAVEPELQKVLEMLQNMCPLGSGWISTGPRGSGPVLPATQLSAPQHDPKPIPYSAACCIERSQVAPVLEVHAPPAMVDITNEFPIASQPGRKRIPNKRAFPDTRCV